MGRNTLKPTNIDRIDGDIRIVKANYILQMTLKTNSQSGSKSFYSKQGIDKVLDVVSKAISDSRDKNIDRLKVVLIDKETGESKTAYVNIKVGMNINDIKEKILEQKKFIDTQKNKYRVIVDNYSSANNDTKSFTIQCPNSIEGVFDGLKKICLVVGIDEENNNIVFGDINKPSSHRVTVQKSGTTEDYRKQITKSFSINIPNYSSSEVVDLLIAKIRGMKQ